MDVNSTFLILLWLFSSVVTAQQDEHISQQYDSVLLQPERFKGALAGITDVDFAAVRAELIAMQPQVDCYP